MSSKLERSARALAAPILAAAGLAISVNAADAGVYVDNGLSDVKPDQWVKVAQPQPVQLLFEFQTNGALNARATKLVKDNVLETVKSSGLFSEVTETPGSNGAILHVVINDIADAKARSEAEGKGFVTGATFFLVGNTVAENYDCTVDYVASPTADKITRTAHHKLYMQVGMTAPTPQNATKAPSIKEGVFMMARQCVGNPLNAVAGDPAFSGAVAPAPAAPVASVPAAPAAPAASAAPAAPTATPDAASSAAPPATPASPAPAAPADAPAPKAPDAPKTPQGLQP